MKKKLKDRSFGIHFVIMIACGTFPFYVGGILIKTFWDIVPAINKAKFSEFFTWQFASLLLIYIVCGTISFVFGSWSKCHAEILYKRLESSYFKNLK